MTEQQPFHPALIEWFAIQCIELSPDYRLRFLDYQFSGSPCDDIERVAGIKTTAGYDTFVHADLDPARAEALLALDPKTLFLKGGREAVYEETDPLEIRQELVYVIEKVPAIKTPDVIALGDLEDTFETFAVLHNGGWVSRCWSVRRRLGSSEAAVETVEAWRKHGFATQCVVAWATYQISQKKYALYSHRKGNDASRALAKAIGATPLAEVISYY